MISPFDPQLWQLIPIEIPLDHHEFSHDIPIFNHVVQAVLGVEAEHFDAEHSHDKFESHGTKNAGALPDKAWRRHGLPSHRFFCHNH